ncbi:hypothetical protein BUALT_Bualt13G0005000 [Buddleja alternifolia]|uniref:Phytochrome A-associated F-box protein n=1 Tax=Buddleja alternifolia TaxID=168488 RepID=A0AAV6WQB8_9LAMI|nr:hypothetical protein BUALT_Bualt13G0005000 [Buddleja alternifolia]
MSESLFSELSDDVVLNILYKLDEDPRNWARIACVSTKFCSLIRTVCCKTKCLQSIRAVVSDLLPYAAETPGGWASLYKLAVCCPGLLHSGVLLENSDENEPLRSHKSENSDENWIGDERLRSHKSENADENRHGDELLRPHKSGKIASSSNADNELIASSSNDLLFDNTYTDAESLSKEPAEMLEVRPEVEEIEAANPNFTVRKRRKICRSFRSHLASGIWNLSREQGNKLLASRFKSDCLYICDWPACKHVEEKRNYMLFRGIFKNFKQSRVWRTISDGNKSKIDFSCVFCSSKQIWDLHSSFCLRRSFGYHDDGDQVVRAYVCEIGHVSGAWTDSSLYT